MNLTPKGDHLGVAQAFCDPQRRPLCAWLKQILTPKRDRLKTHKYDMLVGSEIYIPVNIEMKTARCKITEIKDKLLEHVETIIHIKTSPGKPAHGYF